MDVETTFCVYWDKGTIFFSGKAQIKMFLFFSSDRAYVATLPRDVPVQVLAVTGSSSAASIIFHKPDATYLLNDDSKLSSKLLQQQTAQNQGIVFVVLLLFLVPLLLPNILNIKNRKFIAKVINVFLLSLFHTKHY